MFQAFVTVIIIVLLVVVVMALFLMVGFCFEEYRDNLKLMIEVEAYRDAAEEKRKEQEELERHQQEQQRLKDAVSNGIRAGMSFDEENKKPKTVNTKRNRKKEPVVERALDLSCEALVV